MAITFVGSATAACNGLTSVAITYSPTAGNQVILVVQGGNQGGAAVSSVTDNATGGSSTYNSDLSDTSNGYYITGILSTPNVKSGVTTVTVNLGASSTGGSIVLFEFSGGNTSGWFDKASGGGTFTNSTTATTPALTPAGSGELSVGAFANDSGNFSFTGSSGWTAVNKGDTTNGEGWAGAYNTSIGTGSTTASCTCVSTTGRTWQVLYKPPGGGGSHGLFERTPMTGLGIGGPFFPHPIG